MRYNSAKSVAATWNVLPSPRRHVRYNSMRTSLDLARFAFPPEAREIQLQISCLTKRVGVLPSPRRHVRYNSKTTTTTTRRFAFPPEAREIQLFANLPPGERGFAFPRRHVRYNVSCHLPQLRQVVLPSPRRHVRYNFNRALLGWESGFAFPPEAREIQLREFKGITDAAFCLPPGGASRYNRLDGGGWL